MKSPQSLLHGSRSLAYVGGPSIGGLLVQLDWRLVFFVNLFWSMVAGKKAPDNPWGEGATTLEWTLPSPPPFHQFNTLPKID